MVAPTIRDVRASTNMTFVTMVKLDAPMERAASMTPASTSFKEDSTIRAIYGADKPDGGTIKVNGKEVKIKSPLDAMKLGMAYLPEDRKKDGILADLSVRENMIIALQAKKGMFHPMSRKEMEEAADKYIELLQIKTASRETPIKSLSGGNQQKVIIGRWLLTNPDYLILDEPTRGIDIGTKTEIQKLVLDLADQGMADAIVPLPNDCLGFQICVDCRMYQKAKEAQ